MSEPILIAVVIDGGLVQAVCSAGVPVNVVIVDYDTYGADPEEITEIPQVGTDDTEECLLNRQSADSDPETSAWVMKLFELLK